jgi:hypothetical protein
LANRSHKVIFDANDRFISEADVSALKPSVFSVAKVIISGRSDLVIGNINHYAQSQTPEI